MNINNFFVNKKLTYQKDKLLQEFPELSICQHDNLYSLTEYLFDSPSKYYDQGIFRETYCLLEEIISANKGISFLEVVSENVSQLNHAIKTINEINKKNIHEVLLPNENVELIYFISEKILYEYLKLNDVVLLGLLKPIDFYFRKINNKGTDNMDITNIINTLKKSKKLVSITNLYNSVLRNSIAHGGITYSSTNITFKDKYESLEYSSWDFLKKFDKLIDCVNAITFAYKKIYFQYFDVLSCHNIYIPESILEMELNYKANHYGWQIKHSYESSLQSGKQYNLLVETSLNSRKFMNFSAVYTAIKLEDLIPKKYSTLFFQIKTKYKLSCWQSINLENLRKYLNGENIIVTDGTYFFEEKIFAEKKDWLEANKNFLLNTIFIKDKILQVRYIKHHSKKNYNVIENASVVITNSKSLDIKDLEKFIRIYIKAIIKLVDKEKAKQSNTLKERYLPNKYYRINIFKNDARKREFFHFSKNENLMATLHINHTKQIRNIPPSWGIKEENENCLIVWNKKTTSQKQGGSN